MGALGYWRFLHRRGSGVCGADAYRYQPQARPPRLAGYSLKTSNDMKRQIYYRLAQMRRWANTNQGERAIIRFWSAVTVVLAADVTLLAIGVLTT